MNDRVQVVKNRPVLKNPVIICGINSRVKAQAFAEKKNLPIVYWWRRMERVYFERIQDAQPD